MNIIIVALGKIPSHIDDCIKQIDLTQKNYTTNSYSDFKEAHTTSRIGGINTRLEKYNSVDELKHKRENIVKLKILKNKSTRIK